MSKKYKVLTIVLAVVVVGLALGLGLGLGLKKTTPPEDAIKDADSYTTLLFEGYNETDKTVTVRQNADNMPTGELIIPGNVEHEGDVYTVQIYSTTEQNQGAFYGNEGITSVVISSGIVSIPAYTFVNCSNLESISIADTVTTIGQRAFYNASSLHEVYIPQSVTLIEAEAFRSAGLISVTFGDYENWKYFSPFAQSDEYQMTENGETNAERLRTYYVYKWEKQTV